MKRRFLNAPRLYRIKEIEEGCEGVKIFRFHAPEIARASQPGQFLMVWLPRHDEIPISVADASLNEVEIAIADVGDCTHRIHAKREGEVLGLRGPFGKGFSFERVHAGAKVCLVGGGYGAAPLKFAARRLLERGAEVRVLLGARSKRNLLFAAEFKRMGERMGERMDKRMDKRMSKRMSCELSIATEDGSAGFKGTVVELLRETLRDGERFDEVWVCGPERMMHLVCEITMKFGIRTQVAVERIIKCGCGACDSCDLCGFRVCTEGPVFDASLLLKTEFGIWKRDKSGMRVPLNQISTQPNISMQPIMQPAHLPKFKPAPDPMLETEVCGIHFTNPLMNASGFALSGRMLYRIAKSGAGAVVTKSIGLHPNEGYANPTFIEIAPQTYVNAMGLPNPGIIAYKVEIEEAKCAEVPLILSVFGRNKDEWIQTVKIAVNYPIDMIELNASCPHSGFKALECEPEMLCDVVRSVSAIAHESHIPVVVKISANTEDPASLAAEIERCGADAICAVNTLASKPVEETLGIPILGNPSGFGGMSGRKLAEIGKKTVFRIAEEVNIPIIAVGGIFSAKDVFDYASAGASLFQIGSAIVTKGFIFDEIKRELREMLIKKGYKNLSEVVGAAHRR